MSAMKQTMQRRYTDRMPLEYRVGNPLMFVYLPEAPAGVEAIRSDVTVSVISGIHSEPVYLPPL